MHKLHKVYENDDLMMYFKKRYCHCCGKVLQRKKTERIVRKGDPDHRLYCSIGTFYKPHGDILVIGKEYYCPLCNKSFSCDEQGEVRAAQKHYKRKVVTNEEINVAHNNEMLIAQQNILKLRWLLLIPVLGILICTFSIFNGYLSEKTKSEDLSKLLLSSIFIFIGVALLVKLVISTFNNIDFINDYQTILMLIPALLSSNIPVLWYINHNFKL